MKAFKVGDKDPYIKNIQRVLSEQLLIKLAKDGDFGPASSRALAQWQVSKGLPGTGVYDAATAALMDPIIDKRYLKEQDFKDAAVKLQTEVACVKAVQEVESKGSGYFDDGRLVILFERHWFFRQLNEKLAKTPGLSKQICVRLQIPVPGGQQFDGALKNYLTANYADVYDEKPGGYRGGMVEHDRLERAARIDRESALASASWGLFQIMGFHHKNLGYATAQAMVDDYNTGERRQLLSFCDFVLRDKNLITNLRAKNWAGFAKYYNGAGYASHNPPYDQRLATAYSSSR